MRPGRHQLASEQEHAEKSRLKEKCREAFVREERRKHIGGRVRKAAPVRTELKGHDDAGHDAHAERDRKNLDPEHRDAKVDLAAGEEVEPFQHSYVCRKSDGEGRQENVPGDDPGELKPRQENRIKIHCLLRSLARMFRFPLYCSLPPCRHAVASAFTEPQVIAPTIAPIRQVVSVPDTIDLKPSEITSSRRSGAMVASPPIMIPSEPKLAKPHIA